MEDTVLSLPATEVVRLLRAETEAAFGQPELNIGCVIDYIVEEDFDRTLYDISDAKQFDLVTSVATLSIEPRVERGYWILSVIVERKLGPMRTSEEGEFSPNELTIDEFEAQLHAPGDKRVIVRLTIETPEVRQDFDDWLAGMEARHPRQAVPADNGGRPDPPVS